MKPYDSRYISPLRVGPRVPRVSTLVLALALALAACGADAAPPFRGKFTEAYRDRYGDTLATLESRLEAERQSDLGFHVAAYDEEITYTDDQVGRFIDGLRERGIWDKALVVLTADHGESLHDHDERGHRGTLYNELNALLRNARRRMRGEEVQLDPAEVEELRALGYIQ